MVMVSYGLGDQVQVARIRSQLALLDNLDDAWTAFLDTADDADVERYRQELIQLANTLQDAMRDGSAGAAQLVSYLENCSENQIDDAFAAIAESHYQLAADFNERLAAVFEEYSRRGFLIEACQFLRDELPAEAESVVAKQARFESGETATGDMNPWAKCSVNAAILAAGIVGIVFTGGAAAGMVATGASQFGAFVVTWEDGCETVAKRIWSRLRQ